MAPAHAQPDTDMAAEAEIDTEAAPEAQILPAASSEAEVAEPTPAEKAAADPLGTAEAIVRDVRAGDWRHAIAGVLVLLMLGLSKGRDKVKWFKGDRGGAALVLVLGIGGGAVTTLYASGPLDWRLFVGAISASFTAAGVYTVIKQIISPRDKKE